MQIIFPVLTPHIRRLAVSINSRPVSKLNLRVHDTSTFHKGAYVEFLPFILYVTVIAHPSGDKYAI